MNEDDLELDYGDFDESSGGDKTEEKGSIAEVDTGERIMFTLNPESIEDRKATDYASVGIPGMSHPRYQFTGGGERELSFKIYLHKGAGEDVPTALKLLRSWLYAEYSDGKLVEAPKKLLIIFGDSWPDETWLLKSMHITHNKFDRELNSIYAEVALEFIEYIDESVGMEDVRS